MDELKFLYTEYARVSSLVNTYAASSFSDFQLLGVIGAMLAWEPLSNRLIKSQQHEHGDNKVVFLGFVAIYFVVVIIAARDLLKQSIILFEVNQVCHYEQAIRGLARFDLKNTFNSAADWRLWIQHVHGPISYHFRLLVIILATGFPTFVLWGKSKRYTVIFLAVCIVLLAIYFHAAFILTDDAEEYLTCISSHIKPADGGGG